LCSTKKWYGDDLLSDSGGGDKLAMAGALVVGWARQHPKSELPGDSAQKR
jgi:hypothetical protein